MNLDIVFDVIRKRWKQAAILVLLGSLATGVILFIQKPYFRSSAVFTAANPNLGDRSNIYRTEFWEQYFYYGGELDNDRLMALARSEEMCRFMVDSFDLNLAHPESNKEAFATDLVLDEVNDDLWVLDRAWFQLHRFSLKTHQIKASIPTGRIPFGIAIAPKQHKLFVANVGMYAYPVVPGVNEKTKDSFLLHFPPIYLDKG